MLKELRHEPAQKQALDTEWNNILQDRQTLRNDFFRTSTDDQLHLPVNVSRLIWNAKS